MTDEKPKVEKKAVMVDVNPISDNQETVLVQWSEKGNLKRGYIPKSAISKTQVSEDMLSAAAPYGIEWERIAIAVQDKSEVVKNLADNFRKSGIWKAEDVLQNPMIVQGCIQDAFGLTLANIITLASELIKGGQND